MSNRQAFLLLVHKNPEQVRRLVDRLRHPEVDIFLHVDAKCDDAPFRIPGTISLPRRFPISWGGFGFIRAYLEMFQLLEQDPRYGRVTLLSGQDYPVRPLDEILEDLQITQGEGVDLRWSHEDRRYRYEIFWAYPLEQGLLRRFRDRALRHLWYRRRPIRRLPKGLEFACGSAFWSLSRSGVLYLLERLHNEPRLVRFFENTFAPDEMFFQILLWNSPLRDRLVPAKHYVDWTIQAAHPKTLGDEDLEAMRANGALFARKFEPNAPILDRLDRMIGAGGS